jgi:hypothetical protein
MGREMFANLKSHALYQGKQFNQHLLPVDVAIEIPSRTFSSPPDGHLTSDGPLARLDHSRRYSCCLPFLDFFDHCFSPFLPRFSMGPRASGAFARASAFFAVEPRNFGFRGSFGELQTREGDGQLTEIAEVCHVASAYW